MNRADFEEHVQLRFQSTAGDDEEDSASYALRNAVYAVGCRAMPCQGHEQYSQNRTRSLQLFFNAFSVFGDLVFMPSGLRAVQALVVMVCLPSSETFRFGKGGTAPLL